MELGTITELWRFPVKSMGGERVDRLDLDHDGIVGDRRYAVRDHESGLIASAKRPGRWGGLLGCRATTTVDGGVAVTLQNGTSFEAGDPALGVALSELTGRQVTLEHVDERSPEASGAYEVDFPDLDDVRLRGRMEFPTTMMTDTRSYVDLGAVHLMTTSTIAAVAAASGANDVTSSRFRPNVVVDSGPAAEFLEDGWFGSTLHIGTDVVLDRVTRAVRCVMTTVEQPGMARDLRILQAINRENRVVTDLAGPLPCAGLFAEVDRAGTISAGDCLRIERAAP
jgi:uncharacterized protein YcbX